MYHPYDGLFSDSETVFLNSVIKDWGRKYPAGAPVEEKAGLTHQKCHISFGNGIYNPAYNRRAAMMCSQYMGGSPHKGLGLLSLFDLLAQQLSSDGLMKPLSVPSWHHFFGIWLIFLILIFLGQFATNFYFLAPYINVHKSLCYCYETYSQRFKGRSALYLIIIQAATWLFERNQGGNFWRIDHCS